LVVFGPEVWAHSVAPFMAHIIFFIKISMVNLLLNPRTMVHSLIYTAKRAP
jgi:hypothetical protein